MNLQDAACVHKIRARHFCVGGDVLSPFLHRCIRGMAIMRQQDGHFNRSDTKHVSSLSDLS